MSTVVPRRVSVTGTTPSLRPVTLGVIVGNRGFFPHHLALSGRQIMLDVLARAGINVVILAEEQAAFGAIESLQEARACADLFRQHRDEIDGVLVTLPNFGDERAVANVLRMAGLGVPVLVHAFPDDPAKMRLEDRRDSFCGKMSVCNNLRQYGIAYSLTQLHTVDPLSDSFAQDLAGFAAVCRVVRGLRGLRVGMLGARPSSFNTVRFSEKLLEQSGISVETLDLSEALGRIGRLDDDDADVVAKRQAIARYAAADHVPAGALTKMAKFGTILDRWMSDQALQATAIQCWTSLEEYFGVMPCTLMSMASNSLLPSACETDITGVVGMYALAMASGRPSALVDWNNNYGGRPRQGHRLPLLEPAEGRLRRHSTQDGLLAALRRYRGPRECLWHDSRTDARQPLHLSARLDRRHRGNHAGIRRRGRFHGGPIANLRWVWGGEGAAPAGVAALHLRAGLRAPCLAESDHGCRAGVRSADQVPRLDGSLP